jgi:hypothetical protein
MGILSTMMKAKIIHYYYKLKNWDGKHAWKRRQIYTEGRDVTRKFPHGMRVDKEFPTHNLTQ